MAIELTPYAKKKAAAAKKAKLARKKAKGTGMIMAAKVQSEAAKIAKEMNKMMAGTPSTRQVIKKKRKY